MPVEIVTDAIVLNRRGWKAMEPSFDQELVNVRGRQYQLIVTHYREYSCLQRTSRFLLGMIIAIGCVVLIAFKCVRELFTKKIAEEVIYIKACDEATVDELCKRRIQTDHHTLRQEDAAVDRTPVKPNIKKMIAKLYETSTETGGQSFLNAPEYTKETKPDFLKHLMSGDIPLYWQLNVKSTLSLLELHKKKDFVIDFRKKSGDNTFLTWWLFRDHGSSVIASVLAIDSTLVDLDMSTLSNAAESGYQNNAIEFLKSKNKFKPLSGEEQDLYNSLIGQEDPELDLEDI